jgi:hypothetical protein
MTPFKHCSVRFGVSDTSLTRGQRVQRSNITAKRSSAPITAQRSSAPFLKRGINKLKGYRYRGKEPREHAQVAAHPCPAGYG